MFGKLFRKKEVEKPDVVEESNLLHETNFVKEKVDLHNGWITKDTLIGDIVENHPEVVETLMGYGVHCVGCHVSPFESLEMGFKGHGMSDEEVEDAVSKLNEVIEKTKNGKNGSSDNKIHLTQNAADKIKSLSKNGSKKGLRVYVERGGCSGYTYEMEMVDDKKKGDLVFKEKGVNLFVAKDSIDKLKGSYVDYLDSLQGAGFKIKNPNANSTCGCGESFG